MCCTVLAVRPPVFSFIRARTRHFLNEQIHEGYKQNHTELEIMLTLMVLQIVLKSELFTSYIPQLRIFGSVAEQKYLAHIAQQFDFQLLLLGHIQTNTDHDYK